MSAPRASRPARSSAERSRLTGIPKPTSTRGRSASPFPGLHERLSRRSGPTRQRVPAAHRRGATPAPRTTVPSGRHRGGRAAPAGKRREQGVLLAPAEHAPGGRPARPRRPRALPRPARISAAARSMATPLARGDPPRVAEQPVADVEHRGRAGCGGRRPGGEGGRRPAVVVAPGTERDRPADRAAGAGQPGRRSAPGVPASATTSPTRAPERSTGARPSSSPSAVTDDHESPSGAEDRSPPTTGTPAPAPPSPSPSGEVARPRPPAVAGVGDQGDQQAGRHGAHRRDVGAGSAPRPWRRRRRRWTSRRASPGPRTSASVVATTCRRERETTRGVVARAEQHAATCRQAAGRSRASSASSPRSARVGRSARQCLLGRHVAAR